MVADSHTGSHTASHRGSHAASPVLSTRTDRFDPFLADVELRNAYRHLMDGDWRRIEAFLDASPKAWLFSSIITSQLVGIEPIVFARWADVAGSPRARSYQAAVLIRDAFEARAAYESKVADAENLNRLSQEQLDREGEMVVSDYQDALKQAERDLYDIVRERPSLSDPWVFLLISGRGLGVRLEELRQRFDNAHSRHPFRPDACREYIEGLTEKWGGSQDATFDFARWVEQEAPPDSAARVTLPVAHIEQGLLNDGGANLAPYLNHGEVVQELVAALESFLRATPNPAPTESLHVLNAYALAVSADSHGTSQMMTDVFERIADRPTIYPWSLYREQIPEVFHEIQADQRRFSSRY